MENIKELAMQICDIKDDTPCKCAGAHEICLHCRYCRAEDPDQLATDLDDLAKYIDHTLLKAGATKSEVKKLCQEAEEYNFCSVCINPAYIELASYQLENAKVCTVIGFPLGANLKEVKVFETAKAIEYGAQEVDAVINISEIHNKRYREVLEELTEIATVARKKNVVSKLILETCLLNKTEIITTCLLAKKAGFDFVKTSTGMNTEGATEENVHLMRTVVGPKMGVKASGGVRTRQDAINMIKAGANRIGASKSINIIEGK